MELMEPEKLREKLQDRRRDGRYGPVGSEVNPARIFEQEERQEREETGKREQKRTRSRDGPGRGRGRRFRSGRQLPTAAEQRDLRTRMFSSWRRKGRMS